MRRADFAPSVPIDEIIRLQSRDPGKDSVIPVEGKGWSQQGITVAPVPARPKLPRQVSQPVTDDEVSLLIRELDALDGLEIESMAEKFRANCRLMIEKLDLEYLLEQNSGKENHDCD